MISPSVRIPRFRARRFEVKASARLRYSLWGFQFSTIERDQFENLTVLRTVDQENECHNMEKVVDAFVLRGDSCRKTEKLKCRLSILQRRFIKASLFE